MTETDELERKFNKYVNKIKKIETVSNEDKLFLYGNYKQIMFGNNNEEKPSIFDRVGIEKWKSWKSYENVDKKICMENYIKKVKSIYSNLED